MRLATLAFLVVITALLLVGCSSKSGQPPPANVPLNVQPNQAPTLPLVNVIFINDSSCGSQCQTMDSLLAYFRDAGVKFGKVVLADYKGNAGKEFVAEYGIKRVPAALISSEIAQYPNVGKNFLQSGSPTNGFYTLLSPPVYREINTSALRGIANFTFITDKTCKECFGPELMRAAFKSLGFIASSERIVDSNSNEGKSLIAKYNITEVPASILAGDIVVYANLRNAWSEVGSVEADGAYVFRDLEPLGEGIVFKDLGTGRIYNQT